MSPSVGGIAPPHLLPYESELGASVTQESLILYVCHMDERPSIPPHWEMLPQVFLHLVLLFCICSLCDDRKCLNVLTMYFHNFQASVLQEILADCWDRDADARLTAQCVADRLSSLQSCSSPWLFSFFISRLTSCNLHIKHLCCRLCVNMCELFSIFSSVWTV